MLAETTHILRNQKTWVSYTSHDSTLPDLKSGLFQTDYKLQHKEPSFQKNLDLLYAKNYTIYADVRAILSS